jgi:hypothetical protein
MWAGLFEHSGSGGWIRGLLGKPEAPSSFKTEGLFLFLEILIWLEPARSNQEIIWPESPFVPSQ